MNYLTNNCKSCLVRKPNTIDNVRIGSKTNLMIVFESPSNYDSISCINTILSKLELNKEGYIITYLCKCILQKSFTKEQYTSILQTCKSNFIEEFKIYSPKTIILVGHIVASTLLPQINTSMSKYFMIPSVEYGVNFFIVDDPLQIMNHGESIEGYFNNFKWLLKEKSYIDNQIITATNINNTFNSLPYQVVSSEGMIDILKNKKYNLMCLDIETTGLSPLKHSITTIGILLQYEIDYKIYVINTITPEIILYLKNIFDDPSIIKIGHNLYFDLYFLSYKYNIRFNLINNVYDTMIMQYTLRPETNLGLKLLGQLYFGLPNYSGGYKENLFNDIYKYNARDVYVTYCLYNRLKKEVDAFISFYTHDFILNTLNNFINVKLKGINIDHQSIINEIKAYQNTLKDIENYFISYMKDKKYNGETNINSLDFVRWLLYDDQHLPQENYTKKGNLSTNKVVLDKYKDNLEVQKLIKYREINKIYTSYLLPYRDELIYNNKIYPNYSLTGTVSGRTMCNDPNIQQVPKNLKHLYIAKPDHIFLIFDYKSAEVYSLYYVTKDKTLREYLASGYDFHTKWSEIIFGKELAQEKRQLVKGSFVFASFYGAGFKTVANNLKLDFETARSYQTKLLQEFKDVKQWQKNNYLLYTNNGYLTTLSNRCIYGSFNYQQCCNIPIQCLASDIALTSMNELWDKGYYCPLFIHDSVVVEVPEINHKQEFEKIKSILIRLRFPFMDLALKVDSKISHTWE